jgi:hypothetical protein
MSTIVDAVISTHRAHAPGSVVIEGPSYMSQSRQVELGGLHYVVYYELDRLGVEPVVMPPTMARKRAIGAGAPPKTFPAGSGRVKKWVRAMLVSQIGADLVPSDEHQVDALVLCLAKQGWHL